jgi:hypothetical protein
MQNSQMLNGKDVDGSGQASTDPRFRENKAKTLEFIHWK